MALNNFPYTNFHALNTDWIIKVLQDYKAFLEGEQGELEELRHLIASNLSLIGENQTAISGLDTRITTNATRISELQTALDDLGQGNLPETLIENILTYVRNNLPEILTPYDIALDDLKYQKMNAGMGNPFDRSDTEGYIGSSFNDIKVPGTYRVNINEGTSVTPTNAPANTPLTRGTLIVYNTNYNDTSSWGIDNTVQIYYEYPNMFFRVYIHSGSFWTAWTQLAVKSDITNLNGSISNLSSQISTINSTVNGHTSSISQHTTQIGNLQTQDNAMRDMIIGNSRSISDLENGKQNTNNGTASQADFNDITTPGSYWIRPDTTAQNAPASSYGLLNVTRSSSNVILQSFTQTNLRFYQRILFNNVWSAWQEYTRA